MSKVLPTSIAGVNFFSNSRKFKIMVWVKVFAMKNIVMERILVARTFDIRAISPIFGDFSLFQGQKWLLTLK